MIRSLEKPAILVAILAIGLVFLSGCGNSSASSKQHSKSSDKSSSNSTQLPTEMLIVGAQPSVFTVLVRGDFDLKYPKSVTIDKQLLADDAVALKREGKLDEAKSQTDELWLTLLHNRGRYLVPSEQTEVKFVRDRVFSIGTAFAVSREGIFLSNTHVFEDPDSQAMIGLRNDRELQEEFCKPTIIMLVEQIGAVPSESLAERCLYGLIDFTGLTMSATGKYKSAELVLKYDIPKSMLSGTGGFELPQPITVPVEILAKGESAPGKDVAVLRAILNPDDREKLRSNGAREDEIDDLVAQGQNDKFLCLPLGSATDILPGTKIQALGFPGSAYIEPWMTAAAWYRVSARDGQVGQTKPVRGGYEMIEMTAGIDHGDSGGPVLDSQGRVIGINVGGGSNNATTLAVPIEVAQEFLKQAGIVPDPGELTKRWHEALIAYHEGDFAKSIDLLDLVRMNQGSEMVVSALPNKLELQPKTSYIGRSAESFLSPNLISPYVETMMLRARAKLK